MTAITSDFFHPRHSVNDNPRKYSLEVKLRLSHDAIKRRCARRLVLTPSRAPIHGVIIIQSHKDADEESSWIIVQPANGTSNAGNHREQRIAILRSNVTHYLKTP